MTGSTSHSDPRWEKKNTHSNYPSSILRILSEDVIGGDKQHTQDRGNSVSASHSYLPALSAFTQAQCSFCALFRVYANTVDIRIRASGLTSLSHINITSLATDAHLSFFFATIHWSISYYALNKEALTIPKLQLHFYLYAVKIEVNLNSQLPWLPTGYVRFCSYDHTHSTLHG